MLVFKQRGEIAYMFAGVFKRFPFLFTVVLLVSVFLLPLMPDFVNAIEAQSVGLESMHSSANTADISKSIETDSMGLQCIHCQTNCSNALYYAYMDPATNIYVIAYDLNKSTWTSPCYIGFGGPGGGHWAPSVAYSPNSTLIVIWCYCSDLQYRISTYRADHETNTTKLVSNWNTQQDYPSWNINVGGFSYPNAIPFSDRLDVFVRLGNSLSSNESQLTLQNNTWTHKDIITASAATGVYAHVFLTSTGKLYMSYTLNYLYAPANSSQWQNLHLIVSQDGGATWQHWNGTALNTPFDGSIAKVVDQIPRCFGYDWGVWDDGNNRTNMIFGYGYYKNWGDPLPAFVLIKIAAANATVPNNKLSWTVYNCTDQTGAKLVGLATGFYDIENKRTSIYITPFANATSTCTNSSYPIKYLRVAGTTNTFYQYYVFTNYPNAYAKFLSSVIYYAPPYEAWMGGAPNSVIFGLSSNVVKIALEKMNLTRTVSAYKFPPTLNISIDNKGSSMETFNLTVYANTTSIAFCTISLSGNTSQVYNITLNINKLAQYDNGYIISVHLQLPSEEVNLCNNVLVGDQLITVHLGDINADGKVDIQDVARVVGAFGSYPGNTKWNANCDVNGDNKVDIKDVAIVVSNFGWHKQNNPIIEKE
jgi:hypothetical protein